MKQTKKRRTGLLAAAVFWLAVWQAAALAIGQEVFLVSPIQAAGTLMELLPQADFWQRVGFSAGHILLGFALGVVVSVLLAAAAERWAWVDTLLAPVIQLVKATPVASFIILALVWVSGRSLSILISFLMVLPVLYSAVRTGIESADMQLLEMAQVFHWPGGSKPSGCPPFCRPSGRGAAWRWASAGRAVWPPRSLACPMAASEMPSTGQRSHSLPGSCSPGRSSSSC